MTAARKLPEQLPLSLEPHRSRPEIDGAWNVHVAMPGTDDAVTLPIAAPHQPGAVHEAAALAGVTEDRCLAIPARQGDWVDELMDLLAGASERAEAEIQKLRAMHAKILGIPVDELDARMAAEDAKARAEREARKVARPARVKPAPKASRVEATRPGALQMTRLDERQRELLACVRVDGNVAVYTREERIPDWGALKSVLLALGGKWRSRKGFVFPDEIDAAERVRLAQATGEILDPRAADFFPTPLGLAARIAELAGIEPGHRVLEPSAGKGRIAMAVRLACAEATIVCVELLPDNVTALEKYGFAVERADFLACRPEQLGTFDRVAMNPPFGKRADIIHVRHALGFLKPAGRLVSIMSAGVAYRDDRLARDFRQLVEERGGRIEENPDGSFLESGTGVRTVTVVIPAEASR